MCLLVFYQKAPFQTQIVPHSPQQTKPFSVYLKGIIRSQPGFMLDPKIYEKLTRYCDENEKTAADVVKKLRRLKVDSSEFDGYLSKLKENNFIHEGRFAKLYIEAHARKKWGKVKMKSALRGKGIKSDLIEKELEQMDEKTYTESLMYLAEKKIKSIRNGTAQEKKSKLVRFLLGRGFEMGKIMAAIKAMG
jgi:regulatory protein